MKSIFSHWFSFFFFPNCTFLQLWCTVYPHFYLIDSELFKQKVRLFSLLISVHLLCLWQCLHQIWASVDFVVWDSRQEIFRIHLTLRFNHSWILIPTRKKKKKALCLFSCSCAHSFIHGDAAISGLERTLAPLLGQRPRGQAFLLTSWCFWWSPVLEPLLQQNVLRKENFSSFLWWIRRFERPCLNFIKVLNCPFNLLHLFGVCATILLCLARGLTPLAAAGDVRSLLSPPPRQLINTREVFLPVSGSSEKCELGC